MKCLEIDFKKCAGLYNKTCIHFIGNMRNRFKFGKINSDICFLKKKSHLNQTENGREISSNEFEAKYGTFYMIG